MIVAHDDMVACRWMHNSNCLLRVVFLSLSFSLSISHTFPVWVLPNSMSVCLSVCVCKCIYLHFHFEPIRITLLFCFIWNAIFWKAENQIKFKMENRRSQPSKHTIMKCTHRTTGHQFSVRHRRPTHAHNNLWNIAQAFRHKTQNGIVICKC